MQINSSTTTNSAFYSGLTGLQNGQDRVDQAAAGTVATTLPPTQSVQGTARSETAQSDASTLADRMVNMDMGKYQVAASARTVSAASETLGSLIDITA